MFRPSFEITTLCTLVWPGACPTADEKPPKAGEAFQQKASRDHYEPPPTCTRHLVPNLDARALAKRFVRVGGSEVDTLAGILLSELNDLLEELGKC